MEQLPVPRLPGISEEELNDQAPLVRSLVVERLETIWRACSPHIAVTEDQKPDPRFVEAGIRVLDRLMRLYRLDAPGQIAPAEVAGTDLVAAVAAQVAALEEGLASRGM